MSSVLQVQMLHDTGADAALKARFAFMDSPPEPEVEAATVMDMGGASPVCVHVCVCRIRG